MNSFLSVFCLYACVTFCSTEKDIGESKKGYRNDMYRHRPTFKTKKDIPESYINYLRDHYNINEDPPAADDYNINYETYYDDDGADITDVPEEATEMENNEIETNSNETTTGGCKVCEVREEDKKMRLTSIKNSILSKIGFSNSNLPNMTGKNIPKVPSIERLIEQYDMQSDAPYQTSDSYYPEDDYLGQIKRAFTISQPPPDEFGINVPGGCYFDIPESVTSRKIRDATLWVYLEPPYDAIKQIVEIFLYIVPANAKPKYILKGPVRYKKTSSYGWQEFKFTHIAHHWAKQPEANKGLVIRAVDSLGRNLAVAPLKDQDETYNPMLEMATIEHNDKHHRSKRSNPNICTEDEKIESCCRYPLRVDFVQFGWDWVIAPTGYMANYCSGECRYRHMENNPQAYLVQQTPSTGTGPCCTPSKWYPLAMLYFDHAHTVLYTYMQKMIVERCGCA